MCCAGNRDVDGHDTPGRDHLQPQADPRPSPRAHEGPPRFHSRPEPGHYQERTW